MKRLYYYARQRAAVEAVLGLLLEGPIHRWGISVSDGHQLSGIPPGETFVIVAGHPFSIPDELQQRLRIGGFQTITLDDRYTRSLVQLRSARKLDKPDNVDYNPISGEYIGRDKW